MPSPFPGMDPYLEQPDLWPGVHNRLIVAIADALVLLVRPKYRVDIDKRIYQIDLEDDPLVGIPDVTVQHPYTSTNPTRSNVAVAELTTAPVKVRIPMPVEVRESYLEIKDLTTQDAITAIEILSPTNKRPGKGRDMYLQKREEVLSSLTHLIEIDLLRLWGHLPFFSNDRNLETDYRILVSRRKQRPMADLYPFNIQNSIPSFPVPLRIEHAEPLVNLQELFGDVYDRAGYDYIVDYSCQPVPDFSEKDAVWADALLREKEVR